MKFAVGTEADAYGVVGCSPAMQVGFSADRGVDPPPTRPGAAASISEVEFPTEVPTSLPHVPRTVSAVPGEARMPVGLAVPSARRTLWRSVRALTSLGSAETARVNKAIAAG